MFDQLLARGQVVVYPDEMSRTATLAEEDGERRVGWWWPTPASRSPPSTTPSATDASPPARSTTPGCWSPETGERLGVGDQIATRRNDYHLGVANRDTWTLTGIDDDGTLHLTGKTRARSVPLSYAVEHVELSYATTAYGAQGETVPAAHLAHGGGIPAPDRRMWR